MGNKIFTKSGKSRNNDKYTQKSYNRKMKNLLSHFSSILNIFTNQIFNQYENQSRAEVVAAEAMSDSQIPAFLIFVCSSLSPQIICVYRMCIVIAFANLKEKHDNK